MSTRAWLICTVWGAASAGALAQDDPLRGPPVPDEQRLTIVDRAMTGEFRPVEGRPEIAAVRLLDLTDDQWASVQEIVRDRATAAAMLLVDRIDEVREITDAMSAGDRETASRLSLDLIEALDPGSPRDPLLALFDDTLGPDQRSRLRAILNEYWREWARWELRDATDRGPEAIERTERALAQRVAQRELQEAYEVSLRRYRESLEAVYAAVEPTPQQRATIRDLMIEHIRATRLEATPAQRRETMRAVYRALDPERQERLFEYVVRVVLPDA
ncbi:MAG: hypothetical protein H6811_01765 [Phycisphaeraceae bacterium]|nr:hypothetical protein [Phycisphaeraceae bacterium]